jgi:Domain of unknown function (DUF4037)
LSDNRWDDDPILQPLIAAARADPDIEGLILGGSRGAGVDDAESDYDLEWVLADQAYDRRVERGESTHIRGTLEQPLLDVSYTCLCKLEKIAAQMSWELPAYATARVLYDKTGQVAQAVQAMATMPEERARADVLGWFDAYLNAFYRSLKAWRRGNQLGGQLQAAESAMHVVRVLFALDRRWAPYHDRLVGQLDTLAGQGWPPGYLHDALIQLVQMGDPRLQQELEARVEALLRARGFEPDMWDGEIERVKVFRFDKSG